MAEIWVLALSELRVFSSATRLDLVGRVTGTIGNWVARGEAYLADSLSGVEALFVATLVGYCCSQLSSREMIQADCWIFQRHQQGEDLRIKLQRLLELESAEVLSSRPWHERSKITTTKGSSQWKKALLLTGFDWDGYQFRHRVFEGSICTLESR